jgi:hypothetical protein
MGGVRRSSEFEDVLGPVMATALPCPETISCGAFIKSDNRFYLICEEGAIDVI